MTKLVCVLLLLTSDSPFKSSTYTGHDINACLYVRFNEFCNTTLIHCQLRAAIANTAGRPLIYGLLAATDPVRLSPSFVFRTSSFPHFHIISFTVPCRRLCVIPRRRSLASSSSHSSARYKPCTAPTLRLKRSCAAAAAAFPPSLKYRLRLRSTTVKLSITTMYHRNACEGVRVPPHQIATSRWARGGGFTSDAVRVGRQRAYRCVNRHRIRGRLTSCPIFDLTCIPT